MKADGQKEAPESTDGLVAALGERVLAQVERSSGMLRLALAETRLAASSATLLLAIAIAGAALVIVTWLLAMALVGYLLWLAGLTVAVVLLGLLLVHVGAVLTLVTIARRLARDLAFSQTRRALARAELSAPEATESADPALP